MEASLGGRNIPCPLRMAMEMTLEMEDGNLLLWAYESEELERMETSCGREIPCLSFDVLDMQTSRERYLAG